MPLEVAADHLGDLAAMAAQVAEAAMKMQPEEV